MASTSIAGNMSMLPAAPAPPGYVVHMKNPETNDLALGVGIGVAGIAISTIMLLLRLFTRLVFVKTIALDDILITLSWAMATVFQCLVIWLRLSKQIGVHIWETTVGETSHALLIIEVNTILFLAVMALAKVALCLFYRRLSDARWFQISIWATIVVCISYSLAFILAIIFACNPLAKNWDPTITHGECINKGALYIGHSAANAATDLFTLLLPLPVALRLNLPLWQKLGAALMFVVGSLTLVTSCTRLALLVPMLNTTDITWAVSTPSILISIEAALIIVCICLPSLRLFIRRVGNTTVGDSVLRRTSDPERAMSIEYKPRIRPTSELTLFKGRHAQAWERMPESDAAQSPPVDVSLQTFDFQLPKEVAVSAADVKDERNSQVPFMKTRTYDWRYNR